MIKGFFILCLAICILLGILLIRSMFWKRADMWDRLFVLPAKESQYFTCGDEVTTITFVPELPRGLSLLKGVLKGAPERSFTNLRVKLSAANAYGLMWLNCIISLTFSNFSTTKSYRCRNRNIYAYNIQRCLPQSNSLLS